MNVSGFALLPPDVTLTPAQQAFAVDRLIGLELIKSSRDCTVDMKFKIGLLTGSVHFGA
jgi:hypothetical protein